MRTFGVLRADLVAGFRRECGARGGKSGDGATPADQGWRVGYASGACASTAATRPGSLPFRQPALGWRRMSEAEDEVVLEPSAGSPEDGIVPDLVFLKVPEGKSIV
jgi:hypothetical protein